MAKKKRKPARKKPAASEAGPRGIAPRVRRPSRARRADARLHRRAGRRDVERTPLDEAQELMYEAFAAPSDRGSAPAGRQGPGDLARLRRRLRPARRAGPEPQGGAGALRAGGRRGRAGARAGGLPRRRSATSGACWRPGPTCAPGSAWPNPLDVGPPRRGGRPLAGDAPAQPRRQPGGALHPGRLAAEPRPRRRAGAAPRAVPDEGSAHLGLHAGPARLPPPRRLARGPRSCSNGAAKVNKHVPDYLLGREPLPARTARLLQPRRSRARRSSTPAASSAAGRRRPGPSTWLAATSATRPGGRSRRSRGEGQPKAKGRPRRPSRSGCSRLPQEFDVWQADAGRCPAWSRSAASGSAPGWSLVTSRTNDLDPGPRDHRGAADLGDALGPARHGDEEAADGRAAPARPRSRSARGTPGTRCRPHLEEIGDRVRPGPTSWSSSTSSSASLASSSAAATARPARHAGGHARAGRPASTGPPPSSTAGPPGGRSATRRRSGSSATGSRAARGTPSSWASRA